MSKLDVIKATLETFGITFYGNANVKNTEPWDYTVFRRSVIANAPNGTDFVRRYVVAIIRENYVPEGLEFEVVKAIQDATNLRVSEASYSYVFKGSTDMVVEICTITFTEPLKRCKVLGE